MNCPRCGKPNFQGYCQTCSYPPPNGKTPDPETTPMSNSPATPPERERPWPPTTNFFNFFGEEHRVEIKQASDPKELPAGLLNKGCLFVVVLGAAGVVALWNLAWTIALPIICLLVLFGSFVSHNAAPLASPLTVIFLRNRSGGCWIRVLRVEIIEPGDREAKWKGKAFDVELRVSARDKALLDAYQGDCLWIKGHWQRSRVKKGRPRFIARKHCPIERPEA
jgi:hypothetical protein